MATHRLEHESSIFAREKSADMLHCTIARPHKDDMEVRSVMLIFLSCIELLYFFRAST